MFSLELCSTDQTVVVLLHDCHMVKLIQEGSDKMMPEANLGFNTSLKGTDG